jgi:aryl-alcohol dehydrogenase-like predicted oxidoreductase
MESRTLGQGLEVSKQGFGCMSLMSWAYASSIKDEEAVKLVQRAIELGVTHFDTAIIYGPFVSEEILGRAIQGHPREKLVIATKTGIDVRPNAARSVNSSPEYIRESCDGCLKRLQTSYIDLFYIHRIDTSVPIEESIGELKKLVDEGKIRHIGLSEASATTIRRAHAVHPITAVQLEWSLWSRDVEEEVIPVCRELGIGIVAYSPLGRGVLAGLFKTLADIPEGDWRAKLPRMQEGNFEKNMKFVERVEELARLKGCSVGQLSLAWVLAQGKDVCPIPGTSKIAHLEENVKANDVTLSEEEVRQLNDSVPPSEVAGDRYPAGMGTFKDN